MQHIPPICPYNETKSVVPESARIISNLNMEIVFPWPMAPGLFPLM